MIAACGNHCEALTRIGIGGLALAALGLAPGEWRYLEPSGISACPTALDPPTLYTTATE
jgi:16S rRNA U516 pseudouridylate synthase RsuA-like enzyme